jgi:hypothetical protein
LLICSSENIKYQYILNEELPMPYLGLRCGVVVLAMEIGKPAQAVRADTAKPGKKYQIPQAPEGPDEDQP